MKVILKTITGKQHEVDVEATSTILDVKRLLEDEYEPASLRLCFNGAVLEDSRMLADAGVKDNDSLVLAGRKRKIPKPPAPQTAEPPKTEAAPESSAPASSATPPAAMPTPALTTTTPATSAATVDPPAPAVPASAAAPSAPVASTTPAASAVPAASAASATNTYGVSLNLIDEVASMGFEDRNQIALALRAAFMNVERAVEYLFEGIPPHLVEELTPFSALTAPAAAPGASNPSASSAAAAVPASDSPAPAVAPSTAESEMRAALSRIPQFDEIRILYNQNTDTLPVVMQQIALRHPAVYEQIERDPEVFLSIMGESGQPGSASAPAGPAALSTAQAVVGDAEESSFMNQLQSGLELTAEDRTAVQQLVELGGGMWDEQSAVLVYLATQRNQEVAASVLFEHGGVPAELLAEIATQMVDEEAEDYEDEQ
ncbi:UV excision repair protein RAD23 [Leishmania donovani]|uniref:UV excision repair protein RAD23 n=3 Tax=Leishmania donovani species complex TaxID=38574 RepID=A0A6L0XWG5_LEIIN|nr:UV excision repair RAD23-like protein [Leishmania infantum JPCM5]TPP43204.1 Ubiquitin family protein [Leishmania donovani]CAC9515898.1 UV_excision_repair_RAD23-like_protein [Leishmania infantum]CAJ1991128.1 UV excision repair protein RAD23 [Leishmania donovani]CAM70236.1 UV excision repair RAD23-like protein [Leishmania infantum JPCM5]SUZ44154.1 UV_excision_repair_RAD23-like_protein [Leishmania infantum]|eukprot:XP_001467183.1 UV excision repair RAD23-like protein [Leishmania infantum JPCM5]